VFAVPVIAHAAREAVRSPSYLWDNCQRGDPPWLVIQRTLSGEAFYEDDAGRKEVGPGWAMLFAHGESSRYGYPEGSTAVYEQEFLVFRGAEELFAEIRRAFGSVVPVPDGSEAAYLFAEIQRRWRAGDFRDRFAQGELLLRLLLALYRELEAEQARDLPARAWQVMRHSFGRPFGVKQLAAELGCAREHLTREFTKRYGKSPAAFLRGTRLAGARDLLLGTSLPAAEVARRCGFADPASFRRAFRAHYGAAPDAWRRR
jgi:AraC-like DNA-binding protein